MWISSLVQSYGPLFVGLVILIAGVRPHLVFSKLLCFHLIISKNWQPVHLLIDHCKYHISYQLRSFPKVCFLQLLTNIHYMLLNNGFSPFFCILGT